MSCNNLYEEYRSLDLQIRFIHAVTDHAASRSESEIHPHPDSIEIYRFIEGVCEFAYEGRRIAVCPGMLVAVCDNVLHRPLTRSGTRYERERLFIKKEIFARYDTLHMDLYNRLRKKQIFLLPDADAGRDAFDAIRIALKSKSPYGDFCALIKALSLLLEMEGKSADSEQDMLCAISADAQEILAYINDHLYEDLSYRSLAERFYRSEKSLYQLFRREIGFPLAQYIGRRRILRAASALIAGASATEAARVAGFQDYSVFYRTFIRQMGMTPKAYAKSRKST